MTPAAQLGEGPGCPRGGKVLGQQKWPGIARVGGRERAGSPLLLAPAERKKSEESGGGGEGNRQHRPEQIPPLLTIAPPPGSWSGEALTVSSRLSRKRPGHPPPTFIYLFIYFFLANVYLNALSLTEIVRLFPPREKKQGE